MFLNRPFCLRQVHSGSKKKIKANSKTLKSKTDTIIPSFPFSPSRFIHPAGFSPEHTISIAFRLLQETPREPFALWQLTDNDFQPMMGVVLDRE